MKHDVAGEARKRNVASALNTVFRYSAKFAQIVKGAYALLAYNCYIIVRAVTTNPQETSVRGHKKTGQTLVGLITDLGGREGHTHSSWWYW